MIVWGDDLMVFGSLAQDFCFTTGLEISMFTRAATFFLNSLDISFRIFPKEPKEQTCEENKCD
jgi:hypothetical protein